MTEWKYLLTMCIQVFENLFSGLVAGKQGPLNSRNTGVFATDINYGFFCSGPYRWIRHRRRLFRQGMHDAIGFQMAPIINLRAEPLRELFAYLSFHGSIVNIQTPDHHHRYQVLTGWCLISRDNAGDRQAIDQSSSFGVEN